MPKRFFIAGLLAAVCLTGRQAVSAQESIKPVDVVDAVEASAIAWTFAKGLGMPVEKGDIYASREKEVFVIKFALTESDHFTSDWERSVLVEVHSSTGRVVRAENLVKSGPESPLRMGRATELLESVDREKETAWQQGGLVPGWKGIPFCVDDPDSRTLIMGVGDQVTLFIGPEAGPLKEPRPPVVTQRAAEAHAIQSIQKLLAKGEEPKVISSQLVLGPSQGKDRLNLLWKVVVRSSWPGYPLDEDVFIDSVSGALLPKDEIKSAAYQDQFKLSRRDPCDLAGFFKSHAALDKAVKRMKDFPLMKRPVESLYWNHFRELYQRESAVIYTAGGAVNCTGTGRIDFAYSYDSKDRRKGSALSEAELFRAVGAFIKKETGPLPTGRFILRPGPQPESWKIIYQEQKEGRFSLDRPYYSVTATSDGLILAVQRGALLGGLIRHPDKVLDDEALVRAVVKAFRESRMDGSFAGDSLEMPPRGDFVIQSVCLGPLGWQGSWTTSTVLARYVEVRGILSRPEGAKEITYRVNVGVTNGLPMRPSFSHLTTEDVPVRPDELGRPYIISGDQIQAPGSSF